MVTIFHLLQKENKLKLPEARRPNEVGRTNDPNYCLFHRMVHHPTNKCFILKDKIQALVNAGVLTLKSEQKKVTANMVTSSSAPTKGKWGMTQSSHAKGKKLCLLSCQEKPIQRPRKVAPIIRSLSFLWNSTPSRMRRWLQYSICSKKGINWSCQRLDALIKWNARTIPIIVFSIGWFIILLTSVLSSRIKFRL